MENHQKQRKMKKQWSCKWKKNENLDSKLQILTPNQEIFKNSRKFSFFFHFLIIFLSFFYHFPCPWHLKSRKAMKNNEKQSKTIKNKGKWKKWSCKWKKIKIWTQSCRFSLRTRKSSKTRGNFHFFHFFFIFFSFSLPVAPEIQESHEKQWKTMENHQKQRKMKKNEVANEKNEVWWRKVMNKNEKKWR